MVTIKIGFMFVSKQSVCFVKVLWMFLREALCQNISILVVRVLVLDWKEELFFNLLAKFQVAFAECIKDESSSAQTRRRKYSRMLGRLTENSLAFKMLLNSKSLFAYFGCFHHSSPPAETPVQYNF